MLILGFTLAGSALQPSLDACGDKMLMVGRGARFQRAYASVHPGKVLIYSRPSRSSKGDIRNPQLHKMLRQAGHAVSVIEDWALLEQALQTVPIDTLLVDANDAQRLQPLLMTAPSKPTAVYVLVSDDTPPDGVVCRLKGTDRPLRYLEEVEQTMKGRKTRSAKS